MSTTSSEETAPGTFIINGYKYTPKTYTFTITDEASTEAVKPTRTVTTGPEISYAGAAESGHFAFGQSFTGWVYLEPGTEFAVGADDTGSVTVAGLTASAPPGQHAFQWGESVVFNGESGWYEATASHTTVGGPYQFAVSGLTFYEREEIDPTDPGTYPGEETCECTQNCDMGSSPENRSICFSQPFGRTPFATGVLPGKLFLKKHLPDADIYTPAALAYRHYLTRSVTNVNPEAQSATISADGLWENTYTEGVPADNNAWKRSSISVADNGSVTEKLSDNSEISYDENGVFSSVKSPDGVVLTASQLAVEVIRDGSGTLRQIWSLADGLLNIVVIDENSYEIRWYKPDSISEKTGGLYTPTGSPVKVFVCGKPDDENGNLSFEITEKRGADFSFKTRWNYVPENQAWTMIRGETTSVRAWTRDENGRYAITETRTSGTQTKTFTESVDPQHGNVSVGKTVGGVAEYAATRVASGNGLGKIASETDRSGATRSYAYDTHARVTRETLSSGFGGLEEITDYTYAETASDLRPRSIVHKIAGTVFKTETFSYDDDFTNGKTETHSVTANGATLTSETRYYPANTGTVAAGRVKYEIRPDGTATFYEYSETAIPASVDLSSNIGYTRTETQGVWENGAFAVVPAKSTRTVRSFDTRGNETRTENHVHTGEAFELVSWENKTYAPTHKVIATERSDGKTSSADYICTGAVWTIDENGVRTDNTFDAAKRLKTSTRHGARGDVVTTYAYDADGRVVAETQTAGTLTKTVSRSYDAFGELASETDALGSTTTYLKSNDGLTETVIFPDGGTRTTVRNAHGETLSVTGTAIVAQYYAYGFENGLKTTTVFTGAQNSARWEKTYVDAHGRTVKTERPGFGENAVLTTENTYAGTRLVATASTGQPDVSYVHDALGNVVAQVSSVEPQASGEVSAWRKTETQSVYEKDEGGIIWQKTTNTVSSSDETIPAQTSVSKTQLSGLSLALESKQVSVDVRGNATTTTSSYNLDTKTRTQTTVFPQMTDVQTSVAVDGAVVSQTSPGGVSTSAAYDAFNRKISATDARGNVTTYAYDAGDRLVAQTQMLGEETVVTSFEYDAMNRQTKTTFADGTFVASAYDLRGNKTAEYGNASYPVLFSFDALNQKTGMQTFRTLAGTPEELANLTGGDATAWSYDPATGLLLAKTDAAGKSVNYTYTAAGLLASRTWARGIVTTYAYDVWNRLVSTTYSDSTPAVSQTYDALGRVASVADASGTRTTTYDAYGSVSSENFAGINKTITRHYDSFGRGTGYSVGNTRKTTLSYNAASGRLVGLTAGSDSFAWEYLAGTNLKTKLTYPNAATAEWTYEAERDLIARVKNTVNGNVISQYDYAHDTLGRRTSAAKSGTMMAASENLAYGYNARSELTSAVSDVDANYNYAYAFDHIGNRATETVAGTQSSYSANNLNQYTSIVQSSSSSQEEGDRATSAVEALTYDADGNATQIQTSTGTWTIEYNAENRPVRWTNAATGTVITMTFDSQGRRTEYKSVTNGTQNTWLRFLYDGYLCIQVLYSNSPYNTFKEFVWDPTEPVATRPLVFRYAPNSLNLFYAFDGNKNVSDVFYRLAANGIGAHYDYAPFGATTRTHRDSSASFDIVSLNPFRFSSEYYDSELDLVYYNYRHYSPSLGRFLSRDPIQEQGGLNLYAFVKNAPILKWDKLGRAIPQLGAGPDGEKSGLPRPMPIGVPSESVCENYLSISSGDSKCCRDGKWIADNYPSSAYNVCKQFVRLYGRTLLAGVMYETARCLINEESKIQNEPCCATRNSMRMDAHSWCYFSNLFLPIHGFPAGGKDVGMNDLYEDWKEDANFFMKFLVNGIFIVVPEREPR